ncbi:MAG: hypothetical protein SNF33_00245 (plasmid) [Candidatus Algichlamydia australiensis]|nr:hypothetical protein [Chlamydiales bacterium]
MLFKGKVKLLTLIIVSLLCGVYFDGSRKVHLEIARPKDPPLSLEVTKRDKQRLEYLFRKLILVDSGGYTLLGNKPLSLGVYLTPFSKPFFQSLTPRNLRIYFAWKTWKKYESCFQNTNFMIWSEPNPWFEGAVLILVANKRNFIKTLDQHLDLFRNTLSKEHLSSKDLFTTGSKGNLLSEELQRHEGLLGIVLGYGERNSWLFYEQDQGKKTSLSPIWSPEESKANLCKSRLALKSPNPKSYSNLLTLPMFMADKNTDESQHLREMYQEDREKILAYYDGKKFLETTLAFFL